MWDHIRERTAKNYQGVGSGVYRSTDGGDSWNRVGTGVIGPHPALGRIGVAIDPQQPNNVYAIASGGVGGHAGFYKSVDGGTTFVPVISPDQAGLSGAFVYGWWFGRVWVDPKNSDNVWTAGLDMLKSTDGGLTFSSSSNGMHVDQHALVWDTRIEGRMWAGNDGGLWRSDDGGSTWEPPEVEPFLQPDGMDVSEQDPNMIVVGMQDNGEAITNEDGQFETFGPGGDGQRVLINPKDNNITYACGQNGACEVSHDRGANGESFENSVISVRKAFFMPIEFDMKTPSTVYAGGELMNRSDDDGATWTVISPDLSDGGVNDTELNPLYHGFGALTAIGTAPKETGRLYAGTDDGNLWYAHAAAGAVGIGDWTQASDPDLPDAYVTRVEVDQAEPKNAYVTYSGFRGGDTAAYVLRTADGGENWDNITGDLPKAPVNDINVVGDKLVVATDFGVFATKDGGAHWYRVGRDLPLLPVYELRTHTGSQALFAATFGRGVYKIGLAALEGLPAGKPKRLTAKVTVKRLRKGKRRITVSGTAPARTRVTVRLSGGKLKRAVVRRAKAKKAGTYRVRFVVRKRGRYKVRVTGRAGTKRLKAVVRTKRVR
jgi:photosystem II stability/assembly factor-like uncharacterized protein